MEYQLKLLKIFDNSGFTKIVDLMDELLSNEDTLLNFIILNMNNISNIKYLCNFLKNDINKYKKTIYNILNHKNVNVIDKELFLSHILNTYNENNINIIDDNVIHIIIKNLDSVNLQENILLEDYDNLNSIILYKILNNNIYDVNIDINLYNEYYYRILEKIIDKSENTFLNWVFNICNIYNYRTKTYSDLKLNDNILFILISCIYKKYSTFEKNNIFYNFIEKNIDLSKLIYNDIKSYEKNVIYLIILIKLINNTIPYSINEIEQNILVINDYNIIIDKINNNNLLGSFHTIQNYILMNNKKSVKKYEDLNDILYNKLNIDFLENIYTFYLDIINILINTNNLENNELFSYIITNIVNFYIFYSKHHTYVYNSLENKYNTFKYFSDIFNTPNSNINLDIKLFDLFNTIFINEHMYICGHRDKIDITNLLEKSYIFYVKLDTYDEYYKYSIKNKIVSLYNGLFNNPFTLENNINKIIHKNYISKFLVSFIEDINISINNFIIYYKLYLTNKDYSKLANIYYTYFEDFIRFYKYLLHKHIDNIDNDIITISIHKLNKNILELNKICNSKNNVYKMIMYIIDIFLLLDNTVHLQSIKNDTIFYNYDKFKDMCENLNFINQNKNITLFSNVIEKINNLSIEFEDNYTEVPDEFLDPLYNTIINNPIILPSSNIFVDYDVIKKHLLYHNFDPFNRSELTLEKLEEFNNQEDIKKKISILASKIEEWKKTK